MSVCLFFEISFYTYFLNSLCYFSIDRPSYPFPNPGLKYSDCLLWLHNEDVTDNLTYLPKRQTIPFTVSAPSFHFASCMQSRQLNPFLFLSVCLKLCMCVFDKGHLSDWCGMQAHSLRSPLS